MTERLSERASIISVLTEDVVKEVWGVCYGMYVYLGRVVNNRCLLYWSGYGDDDDGEEGER